MLTAFYAVSAIGSFRTFIRGLHFFGPSPLGSGSVGVSSAGAQGFPAALDPDKPFAGNNPHDIGEIGPLVAPPLLDGQIAVTGRLVEGVAGGGDPDASAGRKLPQGERAMQLGPHLVGNQPQDGQLARCELAGKLRRHRAGRRQRPAPLDRRPPVWRTLRFALGRKMAQPPLPFRQRGHMRHPLRHRVDPAHLTPAGVDRLRQRLRPRVVDLARRVIRPNRTGEAIERRKGSRPANRGQYFNIGHSFAVRVDQTRPKRA